VVVDDFIVFIVGSDHTDYRLDLGSAENASISYDLLCDTLLRVVEIPIRFRYPFRMRKPRRALFKGLALRVLQGLQRRVMSVRLS